ncbi:MAG: pantoate--beta-alanine ligase [Proteobacteria bacterium]|nr:pantoate--beta-alanine ligase [Pseudomonadota bacterium]
MQTITRIAELRATVTRWRLARESIAFVPTMGNLHMGHASLMSAAHLHGRRVISSIFVNPMQFGPSEDFSAYPRTPDDDSNLLGEYGVDALFHPTVEEMYPSGSVGSTVVDVPGLTDILCGVFRPGHFQGVATVVVKLLCLVQPDVAIFGEKDFQQLTVIRRVVDDLNLPVKIVGAPTVRADDGLALSSRNRYLSESERAAAPAMYRALDKARRRLEAGDMDYAGMQAAGLGDLVQAGFRPEYFEVRTADRLAIPTANDVHVVVLAAGRIGKARLIDNLQCAAPRRG